MGNVLCPYPGLRPFEEAEAIFFKGREHHVKDIVRQLERKNFVMITGASGDGKSSIVYAGMIPNIKAGFAKGQYNQWEFAIIKPESKPLQNLNSELSRIFGLQEEALFDELSLGFSSLVDVYTRSPLYVNEESADWHQLDIDGKRQARKQGRNLFILVDQFEELFTNSENFLDGEPSEEAETLVNLLTETVHLANAKQLPIYIVFTMRSDFIGNCPGFRGLPELIGYSHFFIPRLNREEIDQVIAEPALLNNDSISRQLINQLGAAASEGADQLPIVQFALNRIWHLAKESSESMDMIHLAMAGGLDPLELPESDREKFVEYLSNMPAEIKPLFENPSLRNVLNLRANQLLLMTTENFLENRRDYKKEDVQSALRLCFEALTKTDGGRMVRHRSSLHQIVGLINDPKFGDKEIAQLLEIFREEGNSILYPSSRQKAQLQSEDFLDITHEALIRNWVLLRTWTQENFLRIADYNDLRTQLHRWNVSGKKTNFLLALGPLEQFEKWFKDSRVSAYWIAKHESGIGDFEEKFSAAKKILGEMIGYLKASRAHLDMIALQKKKRYRTIMATGTLAIVILSMVSLWAVQQKNLANEQKGLADEKRTEAEALRVAAEKSKEEASLSAEIARAKEREALTAQGEAELAARLANEQRSIAEAKTIFANQQQALAKSEANRANRETEKARELKDAAELARQQAERSEETTKTLSERAFSQALAFMGQQNYDNPTWSAQFAHHAVQKHLSHGGHKMDPLIFKGCFESSLKAFGKDMAFTVTGYPTVRINRGRLTETHTIHEFQGICFFQTYAGPTFVAKSGELITLSADGKEYSHATLLGTGVSFVSVDEFTGKLFRQGSFYSESEMAYNCEFLPIAVYDVASNNSLIKAWPCIEKIGVLKGGKFFPSSGQYLLISKAGVSFLGNGNPSEKWKESNINEEIIATAILAEGIIASTRSGKLYYINEYGTFSEILMSEKSGAKCFAIAPAGRQNFYAGFADGTIELYNQTADKWSSEKAQIARGSMVSKMHFNRTNNTLAALFSDNSVAIIKPQQKTINLELNQKIEALGISNNNDLLINLADGTTKSIPLNLESINKMFCENLDDFTAEQWTEIFGNEYPFTPINCDNEK